MGAENRTFLNYGAYADAPTRMAGAREINPAARRAK